MCYWQWPCSIARLEVITLRAGAPTRDVPERGRGVPEHPIDTVARTTPCGGTAWPTCSGTCRRAGAGAATPAHRASLGWLPQIKRRPERPRPRRRGPRAHIVFPLKLALYRGAFLVKIRKSIRPYLDVKTF